MVSRRAAFDIEDEEDDATSTDNLTAPSRPATPAARTRGARDGADVACAFVRGNALLVGAATVMLAVLGVVAARGGQGVSPARDLDTLKLVTWNIAAINNNPFEYWITHDNAEYKELMRDVQAFIDEPAAGDVLVSAVFTPTMLGELQALMTKEGWAGVDAAAAAFAQTYGSRPIVSGFIRDGELGKKRLVSMPDRLTNTINLQRGGLAHRPTVINCYAPRFASTAEWWAQWKAFHFTAPPLALASGKTARPAELLGPISRAKYPALTEAEAAISRPLSVFALAAFDAILVHMLDHTSDGRHRARWQPLRAQMCDALNSKKNARIVEILAGPLYRDADVIFLQEVAAAFVETLRSHSQLGGAFDVRLSASADGKREQNSAILLRKARFELPSAIERTSAFDVILAGAGADVPVAPGDVLALSINECPTFAKAAGRPAERFLLGSFHGDTNGLATVPVVRAMQRLAASVGDLSLLFGLDANTYARGGAHTQDVLKFADEYARLGLSSCWGDRPDPANHTTFNARTYLQPQLNKAVKLSDLDKDGVGDKNPKDFILFHKGRHEVVRTAKDNTGRGVYLERTVFPTLQFPSDHGLLSTVLRATKAKPPAGPS
jgi:hypothetical protein